MIGDKVKFHFLESPEHDHVLDDARGWLAGNADEFEAVSMQMQWMDVVARVAEFEAITAALMHGIHGPHVVHREGFVVKQPSVEAVEGAIVLYDRKFHCFIRRSRRSSRLAEYRVVPLVWLRPAPPRLAPGIRIFDDNSHAMVAVIVVKIAHDPHAGMVHFDDGRNPFS